MPYEPWDQTRLTQALRRLGELAMAEGIELELSVYGGAVLTLVYGSRDSTKDVDALIRPSDIGHRLSRQVAREQDLPEDWISADVAQFLSEQEANARCRRRPLVPASPSPCRPPPICSR
jgi:hypothetical protein